MALAAGCRRGLLGASGNTTPDLAAFVNGVAVRYLDCNDSYFSPGGGHPSDMISAVLAMAGPLKSDGPTVIARPSRWPTKSFCRLSDEVVAGDLGWDQGIFSVIGAVCGTAKSDGAEPGNRRVMLFRWPSRPTSPLGGHSHRRALYVEGMRRRERFPVCGVRRATGGQGHDRPPPSLSMDGAVLWEQAAGREVVIPEFPLGDARVRDDDPFRITRTIFKSYPSQIHTQAPIGLALQLREKVPADSIYSVHIDTYKVAASTASSEPEKWDPKTRETADHSIPWLVASALLHGPVTPASFADDRIASSAIRDDYVAHDVGRRA